MPVEPSLSLGVVGGGKGMANADYSPPTASNPLALATGVAELQSKIVGAKQAQAGYQARQLAGQILSSAPDIETGIKALQANQFIAANAPEITASALSTYTGMLDASGKLKGLATDSFHNYLAGLPAVLADPKQEAALRNSTLELAAPQVRERVAKSIGYVNDAINAGLPDDPEQARLQKAKNLAGWITAAGAGDAIPRLMTQYSLTNVGNRQIPLGVAPPQGGALGEKPGQLTQAPGAAAQGIVPQIAPPGGVPFGGGGGSPTNPLTLSTPPAPAQPGGRSPPGRTTMSSLGVPLFDQNTSMPQAPVTTKDVAGNPTGLEGQRAQTLMKDFTEKGKSTYDAAVANKGQIAEMSHDYDTMAHGGGWLVPGSGAEIRYALGKIKSTIKAVTGSAPDIDTEKVASAEDFSKATRRMAASLINTMYGQQREAAQTIHDITDKGVPGISNSLMGGKMLLGMIGAVSDRAIEEYQWTQEWANRHNGDIRGADDAFNKAFPAKLYIDKALADLGMNETGFPPTEAGLAALERAREQGLFTEPQYNAILKNRGKIPANLPKEDVKVKGK